MDVFDRWFPPPYSPGPPRQDPMFTPNDPGLGQANYPQPPNSMHNPNSGKTATILIIVYPIFISFLLVPYGQPQPHIDPNEYVLHVDPKFRNMPPPNFQLSNCK